MFTALEEERTAKAIARQKADRPTPEFLAGRKRFDQALRQQGAEQLFKNQVAIHQKKKEAGEKDFNNYVEGIASEVVGDSLAGRFFGGWGPGEWSSSKQSSEV